MISKVVNGLEYPPLNKDDKGDKDQREIFQTTSLNLYIYIYVYNIIDRIDFNKSLSITGGYILWFLTIRKKH